MGNVVLLEPESYSLDQQQLYGNGCSNCNNKFFPKRAFCPSCLQKDFMDDFVVPETGILYTYTVTHVGPKKFNPPYAVGYVDVDKDIRLFGHIHINQFENIKINQMMKISVGPIGQEEDQQLLGVVFTPEKEAN